MNTPDQAPKDGDFVAYIEELERRKVRSIQPAPQPIADTRGAGDQVPPVAPTGAPVPDSLAATAAAIQAIPVGLVAIGVVLIVAGALLDGGIFLIAFGLFLLWQAARTALRNMRAAPAAIPSQAAQQVAALLASHAQRKKTHGK
jgi:hypothetical protein